jgi:hypothetical protein
MTETGGQPDWRPRPDPTALTAIAVNQAKEDLRRDIAALREILEARLDSMDNERRLLGQFGDERHAAVERRFAERDIRFTERDAARQDAVRTALQAAKELSDVRDAATEKAGDEFKGSVRESLTQLGALAAADRDQLSTRITALEKRMDRGEGGQAGAAETRTERRLDTGQLLGIIGAIVAVVSVAITIIIATRPR